MNLNTSRTILVLALLPTVLACNQVRKPAEPEHDNAIVQELKAKAEADKLKARELAARIAAHAAELEFPPALSLDADTHLAVAYQYGHIGFLGYYGYDTDIYRFAIDATGSWKGYTVNRKFPEGEKEIARVLIEERDGSLRLKLLSGELLGNECVIRRELDRVVATGPDFKYSYSAPSPGTLRIERGFGERLYREEWRKDPAGATIRDSMDVGSEGRFIGPWPAPTQYNERPANDPSGGSDTDYYFSLAGRGIKVEACAAEPLGSFFLVGLDSAFPVGIDLGALAVIDVAMNPLCRITPLLARLYLAAR